MMMMMMIMEEVRAGNELAGWLKQKQLSSCHWRESHRAALCPYGDPSAISGIGSQWTLPIKHREPGSWTLRLVVSSI